MSTQNTVIGIIAGAAIGAIAGILLAPESGKKTRAKIATKAKSTKDNISENVDSALGNVSETIDSLKMAGQRIVNKTKAELNGLSEEVTS